MSQDFYIKGFLLAFSLLATFTVADASVAQTPTPTASPTPTPTVIPTPTATPGLKMYQGSLSLLFFGNDATGGVTPPFSAYVYTALPLGNHCNPAVSGGKTCDPTATLHVGAPLTGNRSALVGGGSPASVMLSSGQLGRITSGSFATHYASQIYQKTYVDLVNGAGGFQAGGGPGSVNYLGGAGFEARITSGKNQFGGVMRLLKGSKAGGLGTKARYTYSSSVYVYNFPSLGATLVGATSSGGNPATGNVKGTITHTTNPGIMTNYSGVAMGWPWTTGMVTVHASGDYLAYPSFFPESLARTGYDNRTSQGGGKIQLVTPHLIQWQRTLQNGAIGVLRLEFLPEPASGLVLLAGVGLLGVLYKRRGRW